MLAMISIFIAKKQHSLLAPILIVIGFFYHYSYSTMGWLYQFPMFCAGMIAFAQLKHNPIDEKSLKYLLGFLGIFSTIWGAFNYFGIEPYHWVKGIGLLINPNVVMSGPLLNHTLSSIYPAMAVVFMPWYLALVMFAGLFFYNSTMSALAGIIIVIHYQLDKRSLLKWWLYLIGAVVLYFLYGSTEYFSGQERMDVWKNIVKHFPFTGGGLGYFHDFYYLNFKHGQVFLQEHNEYLSAYTTYGIAGVLASLFIVFTVLKAKASRQKSAMIGFLFICIGSFPLHISSLAIIGILIYTLTIQGENYGFFKHEA